MEIQCQEKKAAIADFEKIVVQPEHYLKCKQAVIMDALQQIDMLVEKAKKSDVKSPWKSLSKLSSTNRVQLCVGVITYILYQLTGASAIEVAALKEKTKSTWNYDNWDAPVPKTPSDTTLFPALQQLAYETYIRVFKEGSDVKLSSHTTRFEGYFSTAPAKEIKIAADNDNVAVSFKFPVEESSEATRPFVLHQYRVSPRASIDRNSNLLNEDYPNHLFTLHDPANRSSSSTPSRSDKLFNYMVESNFNEFSAALESSFPEDINKLYAGVSFLHAAAERNIPSEFTTLLLEYGADPNLLDSQGYTPIDYAVAEGRAELLDCMPSKIPPVFDVL